MPHLHLSTPNGVLQTEIHRILPEDADDGPVILTAPALGLSFRAETTEDALILLEKNLPHGWHIRACLSCRYGNFCPTGNEDNEIFCVTDFTPRNPRDLWPITEDEAQRQNRRRTLFHHCSHYAPLTGGYYTYNSFPEK